MNDAHRVSIAALLTSGVSPRPHEAVAVVLELCGRITGQRATAAVTSAISAVTVTIDATGEVAMSGGLPDEDEQTVSLVGHLLLDMLEQAGEIDAAVPPRLRATALRAAAGGEHAFSSVAQFAAALRRHGPEFEQSEAIRRLFARWASGGRVLPKDMERAASADRRRMGPPPDVMRRFLREAEQEAYLARVDASSLPAPAEAASSPHASHWAPRRIGRALLVGVMLLLLASAGFVLFAAGGTDELPLVAPIRKPTPVRPRQEPGWELLRQPQRAFTPAPRDLSPRRPSPKEPFVRELTAPAPSDTLAAGRHQ